MPTIHSIEFDTSGWQLQAQESNENEISWINEINDFMLLTFSNRPWAQSGFTSGLEVTPLRNGFREMLASNNGALVSLDVVPLITVQAIKCIGKFPQQPHGMTYMGHLLLPFWEFTYSFELGSREYGETGVRDTMVFTQMLMDGKVTTRDFPEGWAQDPYEPAIKSPVLRNLSDDEQWDAEFPSHPLSRVRKGLAHLQNTLGFSAELLQSAPL